jgi:hypothetical protein
MTVAEFDLPLDSSELRVGVQHSSSSIIIRRRVDTDDSMTRIMVLRLRLESRSLARLSTKATVQIAVVTVPVTSMPGPVPGKGTVSGWLI